MHLYLIPVIIIICLIFFNEINPPDDTYTPTPKTTRTFTIDEECEIVYEDHLYDIEEQIDEIRSNLENVDDDYESLYNIAQESAIDLEQIDVEPIGCLQGELEY